MVVFIEEQAFAAAGRILTRDGQLVSSEKNCPHGFKRSTACRCYLDLRNAPDSEGCHGRNFAEHPPEKALVEARR